MTRDWSPPRDDVIADLTAAIDEARRRARECFEPHEYSEGLRQLAEAFARRHGFTPPPRPSPPDLAPPLRFAIESGIMSEGIARDLDAFADGLDARVNDGVITIEQALDLAGEAAIRDAQAVVRARAARAKGNRHDRRAAAAQRRRSRR